MQSHSCPSTQELTVKSNARWRTWEEECRRRGLESPHFEIRLRVPEAKIEQEGLNLSEELHAAASCQNGRFSTTSGGGHSSSGSHHGHSCRAYKDGSAHHAAHHHQTSPPSSPAQLRITTPGSDHPKTVVHTHLLVGARHIRSFASRTQPERASGHIREGSKSRHSWLTWKTPTMHRESKFLLRALKVRAKSISAVQILPFQVNELIRRMWLPWPSRRTLSSNSHL